MIDENNKWTANCDFRNGAKISDPLLIYFGNEDFLTPDVYTYIL